MARLAIVREGGGIGPSAESLLKCFDFTRPETAIYFVERLTQKLESIGLSKAPEGQAVLKKAQEFATHVNTQSQRDNPWTGVYRVMTAFQTLQNNLADQAQTLLQEELKGQALQMDFAVGEGAEFLRAYIVNGEDLPPEIADYCDELFNAWLAENNLFSQSGKIYESSKNGQIASDSKGQSIIADANKVNILLNDSTKGFETYLNNRGITFSTQERSFPQDQKRKAKKSPSSVAHTEPADKASQAISPGDQAPDINSGPAAGG